METTAGIAQYLRGDGEEKPLYPHLATLAKEVATFPTVVRRIDSVINKYGKMRDDASDELLRLRREIARTTAGISHSLNAILRASQAEGLVEKDVAPTLRDGRLVIPVAPAMKRKIRGIVHDESATGKTVFIEPAEVVEANNRIRELEGEERREVIRILTTLSAEIRPEIGGMMGSFAFLAEIDFIRAKGRLALKMGGVMPDLSNYEVVDWIAAVHPLLLLSLQKQGKRVVPLDIYLDGDQRILIISGPNAGGKSVCLKTVGLLQYMLQCGLLVPMNEHSHAGLFESIFIDIGDEQSIEDDLSTYSSHLLNMKTMMRHCNGHSIVLIDEFGSGTDPHIGGAMAEAVLRRYYEKGAYGVITTHYQNLKHFAEEHEGVVNGAMLYDRHKMQALFQLEIGNPGSSFAVEIARKIGLPEEVIADATELVGSEYINADKYLQDIVRDKRYWETKRQNIRKQERQMEETIANYETQLATLEKERKGILREAKEEAEQLLQAANAKIENTIRSIRESQAEKERTRAIRQELEEFKEEVKTADAKHSKMTEEQILQKMEQLRNKQQRKHDKRQQAQAARANAPQQTASQQPRKEETPIKVGDTVKMKGQTTVGTVVELLRKRAVVHFGVLRPTVDLARMEPAQPPKQSPFEKNSYLSQQTQDSVYERKLQFKQDIDLRGMRADEALTAVTRFIDDAILVGVSRVRILHGTGTGALRTLVRQYLATVPSVTKFQDEHIQFGGVGITVVDLAE